MGSFLQRLRYAPALLRRQARGSARVRGLLDDARRAARDDGTPAGPLVVGSLETTAAMRLSPLLSKYVADHPGVDLTLRTGTTCELVAHVLEHRLEGAFVCGPVEHPELRTEAVFREELVALTTPGVADLDVLARGGDVRLVVLRAGCSYRLRFEAMLARRGVVGPRLLEFGTLDAILACVGAGLGVTLLPRALVEDAVREGRIGAHPLPPLAAGAATTGAMGLVSFLPAFLALRGIGGAASAFVLVFASALVLDRLAHAGRPGLSALHFAGVGVGIALSAALVSALLAAGAGWRALWLASGAASLAALAAVALLVPGDKPSRAAAASLPGATRGAGRSLVTLAWAYGLFGFGYVVTATFLVAIVRADPGVRPVEPLVWAVVGVTAAPSVALWSRLATRLGVARAFAAACLVEATGVAASMLWPTAAGALLAAALLGGTFMGITALGLAGGRRLAAGGNPRRTLGLLTAAFGAGQIVGPALAGVLHDRTGGFVLPSLLAAGALLAAAATVSWVYLPLEVADGRAGAAARGRG